MNTINTRVSEETRQAVDSVRESFHWTLKTAVEQLVLEGFNSLTAKQGASEEASSLVER